MSTKVLLAGFLVLSGSVGFLAIQEGVSAESIRERAGQYGAMREEARAERHAERSDKQSELPTKLAAAVKEGTITEDQKDLLLQKHEDMKSEREEWHEMRADVSREDRRPTAEQRREAMVQWAEEHNIPTDFVAQGQRDRAEHKFGDGQGMRWQQ